MDSFFFMNLNYLIQKDFFFLIYYSSSVEQYLAFVKAVRADRKAFQQLVGFVYLLRRVGIVQLLAQLLQIDYIKWRVWHSYFQWVVSSLNNEEFMLFFFLFYV